MVPKVDGASRREWPKLSDAPKKFYEQETDASRLTQTASDYRELTVC